jgi:Polyketide cyclase / dehydrase and lipid transport
MTQIVGWVPIRGSIDQVFDLVTTAHYWPEWHPATQSVGGITQRPLVLGDQVRERARIAGRIYTAQWRVTEHVRNARLVLQVDGGRMQTDYAFVKFESTTVVRRELTYRAEDFGRTAAARMDKQSKEALRRLKAFVESHIAAGTPRLREYERTRDAVA